MTKIAIQQWLNPAIDDAPLTKPIAGTLLKLSEPLSFWGGFDPKTGEILDQHHPEAGQRIAGQLVAMPGTRGSAGTPGGVAEAYRLGVGPKAVILPSPDVNLVIGTMTAQSLYGQTHPVVTISAKDYASLVTGTHVAIDGEHIAVTPDIGPTRIRKARVDEAETLSVLAHRSKAHWGYDADFMTQCRDILTIRPEQIESGNIVVITRGDDEILGMGGIEMLDATTADVMSMFIDPQHIGKGLGRPVFTALVDMAKARGATRLTILSDPQARGFYEEMGAKYVRDEPSDAIPGRFVPWLCLDL